MPEARSRLHHLNRGSLIAIVAVCIFVLTGTVAAQVETWWPADPDFGEAWEGIGDSLADLTIVDPEGPDGEATVLFGIDSPYDTTPRCLAHEISVPVQGAYVSGSGAYVSGSTRGMVLGEVMVVPDGATTALAVTPAPAYPSAFLSLSSEASGSGATFGDLLRLPVQPGTVIILVADDFAGLHFQVPDSVASLRSGNEAELEDLFVTGELSHGALVLNHLNRLVEAIGAYSLDLAASTDFASVWTHVDDATSKIVVMGLDLSVPFQTHRDLDEREVDLVAGQEGYLDRGLTAIDTQAISANLDESIGWIVEGQPSWLAGDKAIGLVVNMSWVLLPCPTVAEFIAVSADYEMFEDYVRGLEFTVDDEDAYVGGGDEFFANAMGVLSWVGPDDDLFKTLSASTGSNSLPDGTRPAAVAAAGNFALDYQMLPAAWPLVVGAGSPEPDGVRQAEPRFSNVADVLAHGAWFRLTDDLAYAGTSYSAPMVSLFLAVDMLGDWTCKPGLPDPGSTNEAPGLAPFKTETTALPDVSWLGTAAGNCPY